MFTGVNTGLCFAGTDHGFNNREPEKTRDLYFYGLLGLSDGGPDNGLGASQTIK